MPSVKRPASKTAVLPAAAARRLARKAGYAITRSKTFAAPVSDLFAAWGDARRRRAWLPGERPAVRKAMEDKSLRITWTDGSNVEVMLTPKPGGKTQVRVQHGRLPNARAGAKQKAYWGNALERLEQLLRV